VFIVTIVVSCPGAESGLPIGSHLAKYTSFGAPNSPIVIRPFFWGVSAN